ncbi:MAG: hypothetical protein WC541_05050 [Dehalococcoidia bacterium]
MTKENLTTLLTTLAGLVMVIVGIFWPGQKDLISQIITAVLACAGAILAVIWPVRAAASRIYMAKAKAAYWGAVKAGAIKPKGDAVSNTAQSQIDDIINSIIASKEADGISCKDEAGNLDPVPIAPELIKVLTARWNDTEVSQAFKQLLLNKTLKTAADSFKLVTGMAAPDSWAEVAAPQTYWLNHKVDCKVASAGLFHQVLMPLRKALQIRDTGDF